MNTTDKAKEFATKAHKGQIRKSEPEKPMVIHPINASEILKEYGFDDNVIAAGYLHDVVKIQNILKKILKNYLIVILHL